MKKILLKSASYDRSGRVIESIEQWNKDLPLESKIKKFEKIALNPYSFYRGTNHLFWSDFSGHWQLNLFGNSSTRTWVQGDAHIYNMGAFLNHDHNVVFGFNDFDDAVVADYQYDLWRMAASILLCLDGFEIQDLDQDELLKVFSSSYLNAILNISEKDYLEETHFTSENTKGKLSKFLAKVEEKQHRKKLLDKWTELDVSGKRVFQKENEKLSPVSKSKYKEIVTAWNKYIKSISSDLNLKDVNHFKIKDVVIRQDAGTGSLGSNRYYVLIEGEDALHDDIILDIKQQGVPTPYCFLGDPERDEYNQSFINHAQRHAEACQALSEDPDKYLGWITLSDGVYSVRERCPFNKSFPCEKLDSHKKWLEIAQQWGEIMAIEHKRAARFLNKDLEQHFFEKNIMKLVENKRDIFVSLTSEMAERYAFQVKNDWNSFVEYFNSEYVLKS